MRKIIEYTLVSIGGVFQGKYTSVFFDYRDDAYKGRIGPTVGVRWDVDGPEHVRELCEALARKDPPVGRQA